MLSLFIRICFLLALLAATSVAFVPTLASSKIQPSHESSPPTIRDIFKQQSCLAVKKSNQQDKENKRSMLDVIKEKPATLVMAPFVLLIGLDLVANIFFLTKRTIELYAFGKLPDTEVWFSNHFFL